MGLTDDQKAMLRLLAQGETGYEDIAALKGIGVEEVRRQVQEALAEVDGPEAAAQPAESPSPSAEPPTPSAPASESPAPEPAPSPPATEQAGAAEPAPVAAAKPGSGARARIPRPALPKDRGALIGLGAGLVVVLALVVVLIVSGDDGGSGSGSAATSGEGSLSENVAAAAREKDLTQAVLRPTGDQDASGRAIFGRFKKKVLLQVTADGLEPSGKGQMYTIWLYRSPKIALQIGATPVDDSGRLAAQFEIPVQLLTYVANGAFDKVDVALTDTAEYQAAFKKAKKQNKVPPYIGESALRGPITSPAIR